MIKQKLLVLGLVVVGAVGIGVTVWRQAHRDRGHAIATGVRSCLNKINTSFEASAHLEACIDNAPARAPGHERSRCRRRLVPRILRAPV